MSKVLLVAYSKILISVLFLKKLVGIWNCRLKAIPVLMMSKTELIAVSGSICALCLFLFVMAEHCLFLCVAESINDLFCFILRVWFISLFYPASGFAAHLFLQRFNLQFGICKGCIFGLQLTSISWMYAICLFKSPRCLHLYSHMLQDNHLTSMLCLKARWSFCQWRVGSQGVCKGRYSVEITELENSWRFRVIKLLLGGLKAQKCHDVCICNRTCRKKTIDRRYRARGQDVFSNGYAVCICNRTCCKKTI